LKGKPIIGRSTIDDLSNNANQNIRRGGGGGGRPEAAIDGNFSSQWSDLVGDGRTPFIEVDIENQNAIKGWFVLQGGQSGPNISVVKEYSLEVKKNLGDSWQTVDIVKDNKEIETNRLLSSPITARYVRLNILKGAQDGQSTSRITEFEVY
jgi:hypothetical protein